MALPQGINFRGTSGYVTDGANEYGETATSANYPTTSPQGNNVGWEQAPTGSINRSSANDARLAGIAYFIGTTCKYRIDLPSTGAHNVRVACGDASDSNHIYMQVFDTNSSLGVLIGDDQPITNSFHDATDAVHTAANWPANNTAVELTFSSTICRFQPTDGSGTDVVAHVYIEAVGGGGGGDTNARLIGGDLLQPLGFGRLVC